MIETLVEILGGFLILVLQEIWPPILAILDGALVLLFAFLTWLFFTQGRLPRGSSACWRLFCSWLLA